MPAQIEIEETDLTIPNLITWPRLSRDSGVDGPYVVIVYNDDVHTFDDVIGVLMRATGCAFSKAHEKAYEIDRTGRAIVFDGSQEECERVADIIREINLQVETDSSF